MIGNDIIDLELATAQSNWKRKGFLGKIFTVSEQNLIAEAQNAELMVWILWSRKEASYKIFNRQTNLRLYNPLDFECSAMVVSEGFYYGTVDNRNTTYFTKTEVTQAFVHSIATTKAEDFSKVYALGNQTAIVKKNNMPYLNDQPVSISHHGKFHRILSI
jgi:phosphopantetheinyl transferase (holo-ACP synthase)